MEFHGSDPSRSCHPSHSCGSAGPPTLWAQLENQTLHPAPPRPGWSRCTTVGTLPATGLLRSASGLPTYARKGGCRELSRTSGSPRGSSVTGMIQHVYPEWDKEAGPLYSHTKSCSGFIVCRLCWKGCVILGKGVSSVQLGQFLGQPLPSPFPPPSPLPLCLFFEGRAHLQRMEIPRPGVQSELQPPAYIAATATRDLKPSVLGELSRHDHGHCRLSVSGLPNKMPQTE